MTRTIIATKVIGTKFNRATMTTEVATEFLCGRFESKDKATAALLKKGVLMLVDSITETKIKYSMDDEKFFRFAEFEGEVIEEENSESIEAEEENFENAE